MRSMLGAVLITLATALAWPALADKPAAADSKATPEEFVPPPGYKAHKKDGVIVYCRREKVVHSRFREEFCFDRAGLELEEQRRREMQRELARNKNCGSGSSCAGE